LTGEEDNQDRCAQFVRVGAGLSRDCLGLSGTKSEKSRDKPAPTVFGFWGRIKKRSVL
jgi:hypothetical protein